MSQATARAVPRARAAQLPRPAPAVRPRGATPQLRVVAAADAREGRSAGFIALCVLVLGLGLVALLLLNTERAQQSYTLDSLKTTSAGLADTQQDLNTQVRTLGAAQALAQRAEAMGLQPSTHIRYQRPDGTTVGVANSPSSKTPFTVESVPTGPAGRVAASAAVGASVGAAVGAPAPKPAKPAAPSKTAAKPKATKKPAATTKSKTPVTTKTPAKTKSTTKKPTPTSTPTPQSTR